MPPIFNPLYRGHLSPGCSRLTARGRLDRRSVNLIPCGDGRHWRLVGVRFSEGAVGTRSRQRRRSLPVCSSRSALHGTCLSTRDRYLSALGGRVMLGTGMRSSFTNAVHIEHREHRAPSLPNQTAGYIALQAHNSQEILDDAQPDKLVYRRQFNVYAKDTAAPSAHQAWLSSALRLLRGKVVTALRINEHRSSLVPPPEVDPGGSAGALHARSVVSL